MVLRMRGRWFDRGTRPNPRPARVIAWTCISCASLFAAGCATHTGSGALFGGVAGTGVGALVGQALGNPAAGAVVGAGLGAVSGAAVGSALDDMEARNRAEIDARLPRPLPPGAVTIGDVVAMTRAGVDDALIVNHIRANGSAVRLQTNDLIALQHSGVSPIVIQALQTAPPPQGPTVVQASAPVIVEENVVVVPRYRRYYGGPCGPRRCWGPPRPGWGVSVGGPL